MLVSMEGPPPQKKILISLAKYAISGQSDTEANLLPDLYGFVWIRFQINHFRFFGNTTFIHREGATDYNCIRHMEQVLGGKHHRRLI